MIFRPGAGIAAGGRKSSSDVKGLVVECLFATTWPGQRARPGAEMVTRLTAFRLLLWLLVSFLCLMPPVAAGARFKPVAAPEKKLSAADRAKIQRVITLQLKAFERNDESVAFSYSTPETRKYFGTAREFMEMVRADYTLLFDNVSRKFLEAAIVDGQVIQPLQIVSRGGETFVALYAMEQQPDRDWRIAGCEIAPSTLQAT